MDTVEQLNGYFYKGMLNLSAGELAFWITVDEAEKQLGVKDLYALASIIGGINFIPVPGKPRTATAGTSPLSLTLRKIITYKLSTRWKSPTWKTMLGGGWAKTTSLGGLIGRWIPWVGVAITAYDATMITFNSIRHYNLIAKPGDRL